MSFEDAEQFIAEQNAKLAPKNKILCANMSNVYNYNIVRVWRSLSLEKDVASAHASFRIESSVDDCQFDHPVDKIDWTYLGPIIDCSVLTELNLMFLCMIARAFKRVNPNAIPFL